MLQKSFFYLFTFIVYALVLCLQVCLWKYVSWSYSVELHVGAGIRTLTSKPSLQPKGLVLKTVFQFNAQNPWPCKR